MEENPAVTLLTPSVIRRLCSQLDIRPTKQLGQNFVTEPSAIRKIVREAGIKAGDQVLEVGPGLGSLTLGLLEVGACVAACEIDPRLAGFLPATILSQAPGAAGQMYLIQKDALKLIPADLVGLRSVAPDAGKAPSEREDTAREFSPEVLVSNLPYNVAVPVLLHLFAAFPSLERALAMVQKEVAQRLCANPGSKVYGVPSVKIAWYGKARMGSEISRRVFYPQPNVDSALVEITRETNPPGRGVLEGGVSDFALQTELSREQKEEDRQAVFKLIDQAFASRRKMLRAGLKSWAQPLAAAPLLQACGIDPTARAENLSVEHFTALARLRGALLSGFENSQPDSTGQNTSGEGEDQDCENLPVGGETSTGKSPLKARASAHGKINLLLAAGEAEDGYHRLSIVFQAVSLKETVEITLQPSGFDLEVSFSAPPGAVGYDSSPDIACWSRLES